MSKFRVGDKATFKDKETCINFRSKGGSYIVITKVAQDAIYYEYDIFDNRDIRVGCCLMCSTGDEHGQLVPYGKEPEFKVGDRVMVPSDMYEFSEHRDEIATITSINGKNIRIMWGDGSTSSPSVRGDLCGMYKVDNNKGEKKMTNETQEFTYPEFVVVVKNTELLKKGGVFERGSSYYNVVGDSESAYQVTPYSSTLNKEQVKVLIEKKVVVEAVKFNPEFVTLEQNELLTKTLETFNKKPVAKKTVKKAPVKKATVKKSAK